MRNVASTSSMSHSVTREWIDRRTMIRSTANSIHELSTRGGLAQPLVTEGAGLVVGIADLDPSGLSPLVIPRALVSVPQVSYTRPHDVQREKGRLLLCRFSDAGMTRLSTRCGGRRPKSAKARNRGTWGTGGAAGATEILPRDPI